MCCEDENFNCGSVVARTYFKMSFSACLLSRKVDIETVRNFASSDMVTLGQNYCVRALNGFYESLRQKW